MLFYTTFAIRTFTVSLNELFENDTGRYTHVYSGRMTRLKYLPCSHSFWEHVDWKGNFNCKKQIISPSIKEFENFYEDLFTTDSNEVEEIMDLESECYIPVLDDPITERELNYAWKDMKKAGYDYNLPVHNWNTCNSFHTSGGYHFESSVLRTVSCVTCLFDVIHDS